MPLLTTIATVETALPISLRNILGRKLYLLITIRKNKLLSVSSAEDPGAAKSITTTTR